jgi:hypothetical protein
VQDAVGEIENAGVVGDDQDAALFVQHVVVDE